MRPSAIREVMKLTARQGVVSFAGGFPALHAFPVDELARACSGVLQRSHTSALQYGPTEGLPVLREWIAAYLNRNGACVDASRILVTSGSQQGLDLIARVLADKGSRVFVESPTYVGALNAFRPAEPEVVGIAGEYGPEPEALAIAQAKAVEASGQGARFLYVGPNFQNPTGRCMTEAARVALAESADELNIPLVEDDPYGELWFDAPPPPTLQSRMPERCALLGSFSKVLAPGLRLGYIVAPRALMPTLVQAKQAADLHTGMFIQSVAGELLTGGFVDRHAPRLRALYRAQRDLMLSALHRKFGSGDLLQWAKPAGGMFIWARLVPDIDAGELLATAVAHGVAFVPGAVFYPEQADHRTLRLSFATVDAGQIEAGIESLATAIRTHLAVTPPRERGSRSG